MKFNKYIQCKLLSVVCGRKCLAAGAPILQYHMATSPEIIGNNPMLVWCVKIRWTFCRNRNMLSYFCESPQDLLLWFGFSDRTTNVSALQYFRVAFPSPKICRALEEAVVSLWNTANREMLYVTFQKEMNSSSRLAVLFLSNDRREYFENSGNHLQGCCSPGYKYYLLIVEWENLW